MKNLELDSHQIITLNDYPVYSDAMLLEYFFQCKQGKPLAFVPVISKDKVVDIFDSDLLTHFHQFEQTHPLAQYFMLDGSHRTTALTLNTMRIPVIVFESDLDICEAKKSVKIGRLIQNDILDYSLEKNREILNDHFKQKPYFMTVWEKTEKMKREKKLPSQILTFFT